MKFLGLLVFLLTQSAVYSQAWQVTDVDLKPTEIIPALNEDEILPNYDQLSLAVDDKEIYLFYSVDNSLYLRSSLDEGLTWEEDFVGFYKHIRNKPTPLKVIKASNGYLHLLYIEQTEAEKKLMHAIKTDPDFDWFKQTVYSATNSNKHMSLTAEEDCNYNLYVALHLGEGIVHQYEYKALKWIHTSFKASTADVGLSIASGFDRNLHIALAKDKGAFYLASRYLQNTTWDIKKVGESGQASAALCKTSDGELMLASSAFVAGRDKPMQFIKATNGLKAFKPHTLKNTDSANFAMGGYKAFAMQSDRSGRIHLVTYLVDYKTSTKKSLCYLFSNNMGKTWVAHTVKQNVYGYPKYVFPELAHNDRYVFIAYKNEEGKVAMLRFKGVNLKGIPQCLVRKNKVHTVASVKRNEKSRIVKTAPQPPRPIAIDNPNSRKTETQAEFITDDKTVTLILKDYREIDGDTVSVFLNGKCVLHRYGLRAKAQVLRLTIDPDKKNELLLYAESEGSRPPCTVALSLRNKTRKQDYIIQSSMNSNGAIMLRPSR